MAIISLFTSAKPSRAGLQPRQLPAHTSAAGGGGAVVAQHPARPAGEDRRQDSAGRSCSRWPRSWSRVGCSSRYSTPSRPCVRCRRRNAEEDRHAGSTWALAGDVRPDAGLPLQILVKQLLALHRRGLQRRPDDDNVAERLGWQLHCLPDGWMGRSYGECRFTHSCWVFGANVRIVMSSIMRRRNGLMAGHGDAPDLNEVVETPQSQDRAPRHAIAFSMPPALALYCASGLVL